jgi:hypothetical protein
MASVLLLATIGGIVFAPAVHAIYHGREGQIHAAFGSHENTNDVTIGTECQRPHQPESPCYFCTHPPLIAGLPPENVPVFDAGGPSLSFETPEPTNGFTSEGLIRGPPSPS